LAPVDEAERVICGKRQATNDGGVLEALGRHCT
jgi:hypothetical protein